MGNKKKAASTIENRVYLYKDLAAAWLDAHGDLLASPDEDDRARALRALADLAYASCVVADTEDASASEVASLVRGGAGRARPAGGGKTKKPKEIQHERFEPEGDVPLESPGEPRRGWGGRGGGG